MKDARIVLVAAWSGWCGACAAERPLVLTRTGRRSLRAWLTATSAPDEVLTLTCRLCGVGSAVPPEDEDPEVAPTADAEPAPPAPPLAGTPAVTSVGRPTARQDSTVPTAAPVLPENHVGADLHAARQEVGARLRALLAERTASATVPEPVAPVALPPSVAPVPAQRSGTEQVSGIEALQLLAEGLDLLTPSRP